MADETPLPIIATCSGVELGVWQLHRNIEADFGDCREWKVVVLVRPPEAAKKRERRRGRNYRFGWNGERLSPGSDLEQLRRKHPGIHAWLKQTLSNFDFGPDTEPKDTRLRPQPWLDCSAQ
jgi:hypothetical protein